jgi:hypothetical protein
MTLSINYSSFNIGLKWGKTIFLYQVVFLHKETDSQDTLCGLIVLKDLIERLSLKIQRNKNTMGNAPL